MKRFKVEYVNVEYRNQRPIVIKTLTLCYRCKNTILNGNAGIAYEEWRANKSHHQGVLCFDCWDLFQQGKKELAWQPKARDLRC